MGGGAHLAGPFGTGQARGVHLVRGMKREPPRLRSLGSRIIAAMQSQHRCERDLREVQKTNDAPHAVRSHAESLLDRRRLSAWSPPPLRTGVNPP